MPCILSKAARVSFVFQKVDYSKRPRVRIWNDLVGSPRACVLYQTAESSRRSWESRSVYQVANVRRW